jgi:serine/threonine protein kinase
MAEAASNGAPFASVTDKLSDYFRQSNEGSKDTNRTYSDTEVQQISRLLAQSNAAWSRVPRIYICLRLIDSLSQLDSLIDVGITDHWLPVDAKSLPSSLSPSAKARFVHSQQAVLTKSIDLEKGEDGRHRNFGRGEPLPFEVKGILGEGGFGQVDKVLSLISFKEYARKRIHRGKLFNKAQMSMKSYTTELETLKRLKHQHIVELVGSYTDPQYLGLVMAPVAECNLADFLITVSSSTDKASLLRSFFGCIAGAISYLHSVQIRHMDIKPQNILVLGDSIFLTDFGIARDLLDATQSTTVGTIQAMSPRYCAPEVMEFEPRSYSADIWSLGCVFLEMFTILKGKKLDDMKTHYDTSGTRGHFVRNNFKATQEWITLLKQTEPFTETICLDWIEGMLKQDRHERVTAEVLFENIRTAMSTSDSTSKFCGICCLYDLDSVESDEEDLDDTVPTSYHPTLELQEPIKEEQISEPPQALEPPQLIDALRRAPSPNTVVKAPEERNRSPRRAATEIATDTSASHSAKPILSGEASSTAGFQPPPTRRVASDPASHPTPSNYAAYAPALQSMSPPPLGPDPSQTTTHMTPLSPSNPFRNSTLASSTNPFHGPPSTPYNPPFQVPTGLGKDLMDFRESTISSGPMTSSAFEVPQFQNLSIGTNRGNQSETGYGAVPLFTTPMFDRFESSGGNPAQSAQSDGRPASQGHLMDGIMSMTQMPHASPSYQTNPSPTPLSTLDLTTTPSYQQNVPRDLMNSPIDQPPYYVSVPPSAPQPLGQNFGNIRSPSDSNQASPAFGQPNAESPRSPKSPRRRLKLSQLSSYLDEIGEPKKKEGDDLLTYNELMNIETPPNPEPTKHGSLAQPSSAPPDYNMLSSTLQDENSIEMVPALRLKCVDFSTRY